MGHPPLKNEAPPIWKTNPPLKHGTSFHEMIPRKSTINKGYLRYKTITSQNVPSKAQIKNFFIS